LGLCIGVLGAMIGFIHDLLPHCTHEFNSTTKGIKGLKNGINALPMTGGQSKSIGAIGLTNDMHIIMSIPKRNVSNCAFDVRSIF